MIKSCGPPAKANSEDFNPPMKLSDDSLVAEIVWYSREFARRRLTAHINGEHSAVHEKHRSEDWADFQCKRDVLVRLILTASNPKVAKSLRGLIKSIRVAALSGN